MARYTAVLDSCALVPIVLADTLLRVAERGLYRPLWSEAIVGETVDAIVEVHPDLARADVQRRFDEMNLRFPDANVSGWETIEASIELPDPNDRHVVAAAVRGRADAIVTANVKDFSEDALGPLGIAVVQPDYFLLDQFDLAPGSCSMLSRNKKLTVAGPLCCRGTSLCDWRARACQHLLTS